MRLRTFLAKDMREALASVRSEMGDDAVIIASEKAKGGGIMVRAACDEPEAPVELTPDEPVTEIEKALEAPATLEDNFRDGLMKRLRHWIKGRSDNTLKEALEEVIDAGIRRYCKTCAACRRD